MIHLADSRAAQTLPRGAVTPSPAVRKDIDAAIINRGVSQRLGPDTKVLHRITVCLAIVFYVIGVQVWIHLWGFSSKIKITTDKNYRSAGTIAPPSPTTSPVNTLLRAALKASACALINTSPATGGCR